MILLLLKTYWKQLAIVILISMALCYVKVLQWQRDTARKELAEYVTIAKQEKRAREAEIALKDRISNSDRAKILADHKSAIERLKSDYEKRIQGDKKSYDTDIAKWRDRVRLEVAASAARLSSVPEASDGTTKGGGDSDGATLALGCKITTQDYNSLWQAWDSACRVYGCK